MDIKDIIIEYMTKNGYDALYSDECGCHINDLFPCCEMQGDCRTGYANECSTCAKRELCPVTGCLDHDFLCRNVKCYEAKESDGE